MAIRLDNIRAIIFDLDGTLLDTLEDLANATNWALKRNGMPNRALAEIRQFVGNGVRRLIERAVPEGTGEELLARTFDDFKRYYVNHCQERTCLYEGVGELLCELRSRGYKLAIVSNKLQAGVDELYERYFSDTVEVALGEQPQWKRKPAPDMVLEAMRRLGVTREQAIYIGDSDVDIETARNSGLPCIAVLWGFRDQEFLMAHGATRFAQRPADILEQLDN